MDNTLAPLWQGMTNIGVLNNGTNADIITTNLSQVFLPATPETFLHDPDGNLTNDGRFSYTWDAENRLTTATSQTNAPAGSKRKLTFEYDHQGRRVRLGVSVWTNNNWLVTSSNKFCYDGWNLVAELNATNNAVIRTYAWGLDLSGTIQDAGGVGGLLWVNDSSTINSQPSTHCVSYDGNGNVSSLLNAADGSLSGKYEYGPFGDLTQADGLMAKANPFRFSSKYHDDASGLVYYGHRYYSPTFQRWLNRDPLGEEGGLNLYGFVENDPINGFDPLGLILFDKSSSFFLAYVGRTLDPRSLLENVASGDSFRVASAYSYHVLKAPVDLVEGIYHLPDFIRAVPELAELARSGKLKCLLGQKWEEFLRASPEKQMEMLGGLTGTLAGGWATGAEGANLLKALRAANADDLARLAMRERVMANLAESRAARAASRFDEFATGEANAAKAGLTTAEKGALGEAAAARTLTRAGYEGLDARLARNNGFDGVWIKRGSDGSIADIIITESKFTSTGNASLSNTKTMGRQLSDEWITENINLMRASDDAAVRATGRLLDLNRSLVRTKANALMPSGVNRWNVIIRP